MAVDGLLYDVVEGARLAAADSQKAKSGALARTLGARFPPVNA